MQNFPLSIFLHRLGYSCVPVDRPFFIRLVLGMGKNAYTREGGYAARNSAGTKVSEELFKC